MFNIKKKMFYVTKYQKWLKAINRGKPQFLRFSLNLFDINNRNL